MQTSQFQRDKEYMMAAFEMGNEALKVSEVPVGCVIVNSSGEIVAKERNHTKEFQDGTQHAEIRCIDELVKKQIDMKTCTLYVTCEPCIMCASALQLCGIKKIVYGCSNSRFGGCGSVMTVIKSVAYTEDMTDEYCKKGLMESESLDLLKRFFSMENELAPQPVKKKKKVDL
ncbi:tRNA(adenine(34)) deaminase [Entamoeba marina]